MRKSRVLAFGPLAAFAFLAASTVAAPAFAQEATGTSRHFGVGIADTLGGPTGLNVVFDGGLWHAEATLGLSSQNDTSRIDVGGHGWFHLHTVASADFSVGGGLNVARLDPPGDRPAGLGGGSNASTVIGIDMGFQIRAFVTTNVAVSVSGGLQVLTGDDDGFVLGGQPVGAWGLTYFF